MGTVPYFANYNRTWMRDGAGNETTYAYNANNALTGVTTGAQTSTFAYDAVGNRTQKTLPNGAYTTYNYSNRNWLTSLANRKSDATLVSSYAYAHDYVGNRTAMTEANGDVTSYVYDNVYRLVSEEKRDSGNNLLWRYQYTYDGVGNRLTMNNTGLVTYTYDANNKLTQLVGPGGTTTFGYDGNGNMTSMVTPGPVTTTYGYDYENRLTAVTSPSYTAGYTYAADGLRLRVQESNHAYPDRWMQYDGVRPVLEGTLSGDTFTTNNRYVLEGDSYYDPLISASIGGSNRYYLYDGLGSARQLLDGTQTVTDSYSYEAFGNVMSSTGTTPNPYRYVGSLGYYQTGSSLQHLGARYYLPEVGRFASQDPVGDGHPYVYAEGNPAIMVDPNGEWRMPDHYLLSRRAGAQVGFTDSGPFALGDASASADLTTWPGLAPHFGWGTGEQEAWMTTRLFYAVQAWEGGRCEDALDALGSGLHAVQDSKTHPQFPYQHNRAFYDDPLARPGEFCNAYSGSKNYLREFLRFQAGMTSAGALECRKRYVR